jgi:PAS domain-containing protein
MAKSTQKSTSDLVAELVALRGENVKLERLLAQYRSGPTDIGGSKAAPGLSLEQIAEIVGSAGDAILTVDIKGTVIYVNKRVEEVYGDRDVVGRRFIDVDIFGTDSLHEKEVWFHDLSVLLQQENPALAEVELLRGDGTPIYT